MDSINRKIAAIPNKVVSAKVWEIQVKLRLEFFRQGNEPERDIGILNIFQVLN
jgi:hypothetical protein